jgi:hypothetical protein
MNKALVVVIALAMLCPAAFAISLANSYDTVTVESNVHSHVTVSAASKVYAVTATTAHTELDTLNYGTVRIYAVNLIDAGIHPHLTADAIGTHYVAVGKALVHLRVNSRQPTVVTNWVDGLACGGSLFVDCQHARADVYYKE